MSYALMHLCPSSQTKPCLLDEQTSEREWTDMNSQNKSASKKRKYWLLQHAQLFQPRSFLCYPEHFTSALVVMGSWSRFCSISWWIYMVLSPASPVSDHQEKSQIHQYTSSHTSHMKNVKPIWRVMFNVWDALTWNWSCTTKASFASEDPEINSKKVGNLI